MKSFRLALVFATFIFASSLLSIAQTDVAALYKSKCQGCHGADGTGSTPMGKKLAARDFHDPEVKKQSDEELFEITKKGKGKMPAYDKKLTDQQMKDLVKYVRQFGAPSK